MTAAKPLRLRVALTLCLLLCLGLAGATAASAATKLSWKGVKPVTLQGGERSDTTYVSDGIVWLPCRGRATAVMVGFTGARVPVSMVYSHLVASDRQMAVAVRRPMAGGKFRARALCLSGARVTTADREGAPVSCAKRRIAIGVPIDAFYWSEPVVSKPVGARGWTTTGQGASARSKVICVPEKAFRKVKRIKATARFPAGKATATVRATCKGGRRPISWGFEVGTMADNRWSSERSSTSMSTPFVYRSMPRGKAGWRLSFATPDGAPARSGGTPLALHLTCAVPR